MQLLQCWIWINRLQKLLIISPSLNTQSCNRRPLCSTFTYENLRSRKKYIFYMYYVFKKISNFFWPRKYEKTPSKVAHNRPQTFFLWTGLAAQTAQKQKSRTTKSPLNTGLCISDYVISLIFFQCFQPVQNQPKSHKNGSLYDFYVFTLVEIMALPVMEFQDQGYKIRKVFS